MRQTGMIGLVTCVAAIGVAVSCGGNGATSSTSNGTGASHSGGAGGASSGSSTSGTGASTTSSGGSDAGGCPTYQAYCGGKCIPVSQDPNNCGGCGVQCAPDQVCSSGACASGCLPGLSACAGSCVDKQNDSGNCGTCGHACGTGMGCVDGSCVPSVGATTSPTCNGSGPPIQLGGMTAGCVAQTTFTWALCSCKNVAASGSLLLDGYDSTKGPYMPGGLGAGLGADGLLSASSQVDIWGAMWTASTEGFSGSPTVDVRQETRINGPINGSSAMKFDADLYANGNVSTSNSVTVAGTLTIPPNATVSGSVTAGSVVHAPVSVAPPCDCAPQKLLPIAAWVDAASAKNDNASIGLSPTVLASGAGPARIDLPCGVYYLTGIATSHAVTIAAHGNTALFIDGDVSPSASLSFVLDPTAQFDVVVKGTISSSAPMIIGSPNYPALSRTYLGSPDGATFSSNWQVGGEVYAGYGPVDFSAALTMYGAIFADAFSASSDAKIHFDRAVVTGGMCPPPPIGSSSSSSSGGSGCSSCKDCGNQACNDGMCGACTSSSDCCAPLTCVNGSCQLIIK